VLFVAESPLLAAHFTREMDRLWRRAELGINERLARKLAANRRGCGSHEGAHLTQAHDWLCWGLLNEANGHGMRVVSIT